MNLGGRKRRRKFCLPSCFSAPSVWDPDELEFAQDGLQIAYLTRLRGRSRTVPVVEIAGDEGEEYLEVRSPAGNQGKGLGQIFRRKVKNTKATAQNATHSPRSTRAHIQQSIFCHVSTNYQRRRLRRPRLPGTAKEVDLDSSEYKRKVVLMGLLERNRYGISGTNGLSGNG
ncbi:uncharacterized protein LOC110019249 [Phalaenopsis equestris]|uniref:uncharacterized protein LOC110019249 n=1 Tax=Phalaenopsis equestris TaxID=78828 RepID=UPI0009E4E7D1|nr:uncharacterized protein LOC110019249 [Phalaenopsis equestris]